MVIAVVVLMVAWHYRPLDPEAWRAFAREAREGELERLADDNSRELNDRWNQYLRALRSGDEEAFQVARRLCPLIVRACTLPRSSSGHLVGASSGGPLRSSIW